MSHLLTLHPDRLMPVDPSTREIARRLHAGVEELPILSPHGHVDPAWFAEDLPFRDPVDLLITRDHYVFRMLYSLGVPLEQLGILPRSGEATAPAPLEIWRCFAAHYYAFRGTPTRLWLDYVFAEVFGIDRALDDETAEDYFDHISHCLSEPAFRPRALFERFNIEVLATTESPLDDLHHHSAIQESGWPGRVISTFRPDPVLDPEFEEFPENLARLGELTGEDTTSFAGYLRALRERRQFFAAMGATATDHGHPSAVTANLSRSAVEQLFEKACHRRCSKEEAELFRGHMLTEMAGMSLDDGLVMQIHPGAHRNHNPWVYERFGRDMGADLPTPTHYVDALKPLLDRYGNESRLTIILFTLDESTYSRELAPLAGHYPALKLGPPWWFHDSPEGMRRFRTRVTDTAGFYNTVGFNDDTRAFLSIPARHDVARRMDCAHLAGLVADYRLTEEEAAEIAADLAYHLAKRTYKL